jgi:hypothetical protein
MNGLSRFYSLSKSNWLSLYCRQPDLYEESPGSSEYSTESTFLVHTAGNKTEQAQAEIGSLHQDIRTGSQSIHIGEQKEVGECEKGVIFGATTKQGNEILYGIQGPISFLFLLFKIPHWIRITDKNIWSYCRDIHVLWWTTKRWRSCFCLIKYRVWFPSSSNPIVQIISSRNPQPKIFRKCKLF